MIVSIKCRLILQFLGVLPADSQVHSTLDRQYHHFIKQEEYNSQSMQEIKTCKARRQLPSLCNLFVIMKAKFMEDKRRKLEPPFLFWNEKIVVLPPQNHF